MCSTRFHHRGDHEQPTSNLGEKAQVPQQDKGVVHKPEPDLKVQGGPRGKPPPTGTPHAPGPGGPSACEVSSPPGKARGPLGDCQVVTLPCPSFPVCFWSSPIKPLSWEKKSKSKTKTRFVVRVNRHFLTAGAGPAPSGSTIKTTNTGADAGRHRTEGRRALGAHITCSKSVCYFPLFPR